MPLFTLANACDRSVKERDSATISVVVDDTWCRTEVSSRTDCAFKADWMTRQVCERQSSGVWHIAQVLRRYGPNFLLPSLSLSLSAFFSLATRRYSSILNRVPCSSSQSANWQSEWRMELWAYIYGACPPASRKMDSLSSIELQVPNAKHKISYICYFDCILVFSIGTENQTLRLLRY